MRHLGELIAGTLLIALLSLLPGDDWGSGMFLGLCFLLWVGFQFLSTKTWRWTLLFWPAAGSVCIFLLDQPSAYPHQLFAVSLAYLMLLSLVLMLLNRWIFKHPYTLKAHFQRRYIYYGLGCFLLLWATTTMDQSHPFGPHFQLKVMVWLLFMLLVLNWMIGHFKWIRSLEAAKSEAELSNLKNQIHPHFLFNTLNNIYGLAREKSDLAPEMIMSLSDFLRYSLQHANQENVTLGAEVEHLKNYLALQGLRHKDSQFEFNVDIQNPEVKVAPLIFLPLVENAFKHGADLVPETKVNILLKEENRMVRLHVDNGNSAKERPGNGGTGLVNLKKRLDLEYAERYLLNLDFQGEKAVADLEIQL